MADLDRANIIGRLEAYARTAQHFAQKRQVLPELDRDLFFRALADAGDYNRAHPEDPIPPLDRVRCMVGTRPSDTPLLDRWRTA